MAKSEGYWNYLPDAVNHRYIEEVGAANFFTENDSDPSSQELFYQGSRILDDGAGKIQRL